MRIGSGFSHSTQSSRSSWSDSLRLSGFFNRRRSNSNTTSRSRDYASSPQVIPGAYIDQAKLQHLLDYKYKGDYKLSVRLSGLTSKWPQSHRGSRSTSVEAFTSLSMQSHFRKGAGKDYCCLTGQATTVAQMITINIFHGTANEGLFRSLSKRQRSRNMPAPNHK